MAVETVNLVVKVPVTLRKRARAVAVLRGETVSDVVRKALAEYIARSESAPDDLRFAEGVLARIAEGAPTYAHDEVWAEIERREAAGELPD
jgi:predicted DNA-binding protein